MITTEHKNDNVLNVIRKLDRFVSGDIKRDSAIYASALRSCKDAALGIRIHEHIVKCGHGTDSFLGNLLVNMYGKNSCIDQARLVFNRILYRNVFSWNIIIAAYAQNDLPDESLAMFRAMLLAGLKPDKITFIGVLDACADLGLLHHAKEAHRLVIEAGFELDQVVLNSLVNMFGNCGSWNDARSVFDRFIHRDDPVLWNSMISACVRNGEFNLALKLFRRMHAEGPRPNKVTFINTLRSITSVTPVDEIQQFIELVSVSKLETDLSVATGLINMLGRIGHPESAKQIFDKLPRADLISWTAMLTAYARNGNFLQALMMFRLMNLEGVKPNKITLISIMDVCSHLGDLKVAESIGGLVDFNEVFVCNGAINMYGGCGSVESAREIFDKLAFRGRLDPVSFTVMISTYARKGLVKESKELLQIMQLEGQDPDDLTHTCMLEAFRHAGLLCEGWKQFVSMISDHGISPKSEHYGCMVDLLVRNGKLDEAEELVNETGCGSDQKTLVNLLWSCNVYQDFERGQRLGRDVVGELNSSNNTAAAAYVLLSNIHGNAKI